MYQEHLKAFQADIEMAARSFCYFKKLTELSASDSQVLNALNNASQFWLDHQFSALQTTIMFLGKIYSRDIKKYQVHNLQKLLEAASANLSHFSRQALKQRIGTISNIDEYVANAHELDTNDLEAIAIEARKAQMIWDDKVAALRDKFYAHREIMTEEELQQYFDAAKAADIENLLRILMNIHEALTQAELNGRKPVFNDIDHLSDYWNRGIPLWLNETEKMLHALVRGYDNP